MDWQAHHKGWPGTSPQLAATGGKPDAKDGAMDGSGEQARSHDGLAAMDAAAGTQDRAGMFTARDGDRSSTDQGIAKPAAPRKYLR